MTPWNKPSTFDPLPMPTRNKFSPILKFNTPQHSDSSTCTSTDLLKPIQSTRIANFHNHGLWMMSSGLPPSFECGLVTLKLWMLRTLSQDPCHGPFMLRAPRHLSILWSSDYYALCRNIRTRSRIRLQDTLILRPLSMASCCPLSCRADTKKSLHVTFNPSPYTRVGAF